MSKHRKRAQTGKAYRDAVERAADLAVPLLALIERLKRGLVLSLRRGDLLAVVPVDAGHNPRRRAQKSGAHRMSPAASLPVNSRLRKSLGRRRASCVDDAPPSLWTRGQPPA